MVLIQPILDSIISVWDGPIDKIFYVIQMTLPSIHPEYATITVFEETVFDRLLKGLVDGVIFDMQLNPKRLHPANTLLHIPDDITGKEPINADTVIQTLWEEVTGPVSQMILASILRLHDMDTLTILNALTEYFHDSDICRG